jgi:hypothetical protein
MALTGIIGALALVPAAKRARRIAADRCKSEDEQRTNTDRMQALVHEVEALASSRAQLLDHIELLERELAAERQMSAHWLAEAQRLIRDRRAQQDMALYQQQALLGQSQSCQQQAFAQYNPLAQQNQQLGASLNARNCVPSRAQVWGAQHGLVNRLNQGDG